MFLCVRKDVVQMQSNSPCLQKIYYYSYYLSNNYILGNN